MCSILITNGYSFSEHTSFANSMAIRGIESTNRSYSKHNLIITHNRLPLQKSSEQQPYTNLDTDYYLVGEYYEDYTGNEIEHLYRRIMTGNWDCDWEGTIFIHHIWTDTITIIVDPLRKRPVFFYQKDPEHFIISNDFSLYTKLDDIEVDKIELSIIQRNGFSYDDSTPLKHIVCLKPGIHHIRIGNNSTYLRYYPPHPALSDNEKLFNKITTSVINRIKPNTLSKSFGTYLSGGIDSTILHRIIDDHYKQKGELPGFCDKIPAFILYNLCNDDEKRNIEYLEKSTEVFDFIFRKYVDQNMLSRVDSVLKWFSFPVDLGSVLPQIALTEIVAEYRGNSDLYAILTGDGADEFFGGYKRNFEYDSRYYDIFIELIYYHNLRLDQIPFKRTIEIRTPFQALPLLYDVLTMSYRERIDKRKFREFGKTILPPELMNIKKYPLKILPERLSEYRKFLVEEFAHVIQHKK